MTLILAAGFLLPCHLAAAAEVHNYLGAYESQEEADIAGRIHRAFLMREYDEAWQLAEKGIEQFPQSFDIARLYTEVSQVTQHTATALAKFSSLLRDEDTKATGHYGQGYTAFLLGDLSAAFSELTTARKISGGDDLEIRRALLVVSRMSRDTKPADVMNQYKVLVADYEDVGVAHLSYINTFNFFRRYLGGGEHEAALEAAFAAPHTAPETWLRKADFMERELWFDPAAGLEVVEEGLRAYPWHPDLALRRISYLRQLGQTEDALTLVRQWRKITPNHGDFVNDEIDILSDLFRWDEAVAAAEGLTELTLQTSYRDSRSLQVARVLHIQGRDDDAIAELEKFLVENPMSRAAGEANALLLALRQREPDAKVVLLENDSYLRQKGNYCGPTSLSMLLHYFGIELNQDEIAKEVYTGIAGTPPQVIHNFVNQQGLDSIEFNGTPETWKRLIDAGFPVLWLKMLGRRGGHYYLIVGYDDVMKNWLVHNPNYATRTRVSYDEVDDEWILPGLRRSIVVFPESDRDNPALAGIGPTPMLLASNWLLYVATGSNLHGNFIVGFLTNLIFACLLALGIAWLVKQISFPNKGLHPSRFVAIVLAVVIPLNLLVAFVKSGEAVSLFLGLHLGLMTLIVLLSIFFVLQRAVHDFLHPRESIGLCALTILVWVSLALVDNQPWETLIPLGVFVVGLPIILAPRFQIKRGESAMRYGDATRALDLVQTFGLKGRRYFSATCIEMDGLLAIGESEQLVQFAEEILKSSDWPRLNEEAIELHRLMGITLSDPSSKPRNALETFLRRKKLSKAARLVARAQVLYLDGKGLNTGELEGVSSWRNADVNELLRLLHRAAERKLPGVPPTRASRSYAILRAACLMAFHGGITQAIHSGDDEQRASLWRSYGKRYGLELNLLRSLDQADKMRGDAFDFFGEHRMRASDAQTQTDDAPATA